MYLTSDQLYPASSTVCGTTLLLSSLSSSVYETYMEMSFGLTSYTCLRSFDTFEALDRPTTFSSMNKETVSLTLSSSSPRQQI